MYGSPHAGEDMAGAVRRRTELHGNDVALCPLWAKSNKTDSIFMYGAMVAHAPQYSGILQGLQVSDTTPFS